LKMFSFRSGSLLATVTLSLIGCDPMEPRQEEKPKSEEHSNSKLGPASPAPPVIPSPVPQLPEPGASEMKPEVNKEEPKVEPKVEAPK